MYEVLNTPLFGITISILAFKFGLWVNKKVKNPLANPLIIAMALIILVLVVFDIPLESYELGSSIIILFLGPITAVLAGTIYRQRALLKSSLLPIVLGTLAGSIASLLSIRGMSSLLAMNQEVFASLVGKSVTTPIAIAITEEMGGIPALTVASTVISGTLGNLLAPVLAKMFFIKDPVAHGVGIGSCSHALGTSKALEIGEVEGAMSSIAISFSGIFTVLLAPLLFL